MESSELLIVLLSATTIPRLDPKSQTGDSSGSEKRGSHWLDILPDSANEKPSIFHAVLEPICYPLGPPARCVR